jgi:hypothetical protein
MEHSEYDLAAKDRRPWNAGRMNGAKRALDRPAASVSRPCRAVSQNGSFLKSRHKH